MPSKPADAAASSFSSSVPLRQTVAIERFIATAAGSIRRSRWRSIRSRSGVTPVNSSSEPAACMTAIPPPSSVRHPSSRARLTSSVSSGR